MFGANHTVSKVARIYHLVSVADDGDILNITPGAYYMTVIMEVNTSMGRSRTKKVGASENYSSEPQLN